MFQTNNYTLKPIIIFSLLEFVVCFSCTLQSGYRIPFRAQPRLHHHLLVSDDVEIDR